MVGAAAYQAIFCIDTKLHSRTARVKRRGATPAIKKGGTHPSLLVPEKGRRTGRDGGSFACKKEHDSGKSWMEQASIEEY